MTYYEQLMKDCMALHDRKSHDYAQDNNRYSNFTRAAGVVSWFKDPIDQVFSNMIAIKLARLAELLNGKTPNNESIRDTFLDLTNYSALWGSYHDSLTSLRTHESKKPASATCATCGEMFYDLLSLDRHFCKAHAQDELQWGDYGT